MVTKAQLLEPLAKLRTDQAIVATMGVVRPWGRMSGSDLDFASADSAMGHAADLALGVAMAQPSRQVICLNGDGSMLMSLGTLATIVESSVRNLVLFVLVNGTYEITGNQRTPGAGTIDFAAMAKAAGFPRVYRFENGDEYQAALAEVLSGEGPVFVSVEMEPGSEGPISRSAAEDTEYLKVSLADWARRFRHALTGL
jgi:thiamine pyrophosphate-dependent acetolactate synthase large subunit-like protein